MLSLVIMDGSDSFYIIYFLFTITIVALSTKLTERALIPAFGLLGFERFAQLFIVNGAMVSRVLNGFE